MELASGSGSESSRSSVKDRSGYRSGHNEDVLSKLLPGAAPGKEQGWTDRGIATSRKPVGGFKKPEPKKGGKAKTKTKHLEPNYSSSTTDGEVVSSGKAKRMKKKERECENKEVKNIVVDAAEGLPPRKVRIWVKFLKDFNIVCEEDDGLYTAGRHLGLGSLAVEMQHEILDGRWDITEGGEFVLSARGRKITEREKGSGGNRKLVSPGPKCGITTTEDESAEEAGAGPVGREPQWIPPKNRAEAPPGYSQAWENFLVGMEVFVESEGQRLPGPNYRFLGEYEASKEDILRNRLKVGNKGSLIVDPDGRGHHDDGEVTEEEKRTVMRRLGDYNLTHESHRIIHLRALRREGFGSPLDEFELDVLNNRGDGED